MTPHEFLDLYNGYIRRIEDEEIRRYQLGAWIAAGLISVWAGKQIRPTDLFDAEKALKERNKKPINREEQERLVKLAKERGRLNG